MQEQNNNFERLGLEGKKELSVTGVESVDWVS